MTKPAQAEKISDKVQRWDCYAVDVTDEVCWWGGVLPGFLNHICMFPPPRVSQLKLGLRAGIGIGSPQAWSRQL